MADKPHPGLFLLTIAAALNAGTILLCDSTCVKATIVDTSGGFVTVRHSGRDIRIDKNQVLKIDAGADSLSSNPDKSRDAGPAAHLSVSDALAHVLAGYAVKKTAIARGKGIAFQKQPLVATSGVGEKTAAAFSDRLVRFLARHAPVRTISKEGAYFHLSDGTMPGENCRYLAMPAEISVRSSERKMSVSSFATLDKAGNFVPAKTGTTLQARERETTVRFVIIDLSDKTIVFDERVKDVDKGLQSLGPENTNDTRNTSVNNSILTIEGKIETLLKKRFK